VPVKALGVFGKKKRPVAPDSTPAEGVAAAGGAKVDGEEPSAKKAKTADSPSDNKASAAPTPASTDEPAVVAPVE